jgi:hypothetical protein
MRAHTFAAWFWSWMPAWTQHDGQKQQKHKRGDAVWRK